jgi:hypothetical protein
MSNIKVKSNLMIKSRMKNQSWNTFAPADLLINMFPEYRDSRANRFLTQQQREEKEKTLFYASRIEDI